MVVTGRTPCSILLYIMLQIHSVEHSYGLGGESLRETFTICTYASLTAHSFSTLVTPQCNPVMCNRTSCAQVHELPYFHYGGNREGTLFYCIVLYCTNIYFLQAVYLEGPYACCCLASPINISYTLLCYIEHGSSVNKKKILKKSVSLLYIAENLRMNDCPKLKEFLRLVNKQMIERIEFFLEIHKQ